MVVPATGLRLRVSRSVLSMVGSGRASRSLSVYIVPYRVQESRGVSQEFRKKKSPHHDHEPVDPRSLGQAGRALGESDTDVLANQEFGLRAKHHVDPGVRDGNPQHGGE